MAGIAARWQDWSGGGLEHLVLTVAPDGITAESVLIGSEDGAPFAARYRLVCGPDWHVRVAALQVVGGGGIDLRSDGRGGWTDGGGRTLPELDGAIDIDISATPFTNTLPIRRLATAAGQSADILVAYVTLPALTISTDRQRYVCLDPGRRYRFESTDTGFTREIDIDDDGLVVTYPGLFRRIS